MVNPRLRLLAPVILAAFIAAPVHAQNMSDMGPMDHMAMHDSHLGPHSMKNMELHMTWSDARPGNPADQGRAAQLVSTLQRTLAKYRDDRVAEADGYKPFHPEFKQQSVVHFTNWWYAIKAQFEFNPSEPTSLLYRRAAGGGYVLIGAMYTAPRRWTGDKLDARVPLSVARWHQHVNLCFPPKHADPADIDWSRFGPNGSIASKAECAAAGGRFFPTLFGWMVHVYPWESDPHEVWAH